MGVILLCNPTHINHNCLGKYRVISLMTKLYCIFLLVGTNNPKIYNLFCLADVPLLRYLCLFVFRLLLPLYVVLLVSSLTVYVCLSASFVSLVVAVNLSPFRNRYKPYTLIYLLLGLFHILISCSHSTGVHSSKVSFQ